jgi:(p)ppGpp synthase/HD superfamily hydrolase
MSGTDRRSIEDAIALAARAHRGQQYPSPEREPYIFHPLRVMLRSNGTVDQMAAVLHDVVEDTDVSVDELLAEGYPTEVAVAVECLTRRSGEAYEDYIDRLAANDVARRVKIADLDENLANNRRSPNNPGNAERIERYTSALKRLGGSVP